MKVRVAPPVSPTSRQAPLEREFYSVSAFLSISFDSMFSDPLKVLLYVMTILLIMFQAIDRLRHYYLEQQRWGKVGGKKKHDSTRGRRSQNLTSPSEHKALAQNADARTPYQRASSKTA